MGLSDRERQAFDAISRQLLDPAEGLPTRTYRTWFFAWSTGVAGSLAVIVASIAAGIPPVGVAGFTALVFTAAKAYTARGLLNLTAAPAPPAASADTDGSDDEFYGQDPRL